MTLKDFLSAGQKKIKEAQLHCADPTQHIEQLVTRTFEWTSADLFLKKETTLSPSELSRLNEVLERRLKREPLQYILGFEYFYESKFTVGPGCLIPRRETELLVDEVLAFSKTDSIRVAELGAGSGNIGMSVLLKNPKVSWWAYEINPQSLGFARKNQSDLLSDRHRYFLLEEDFFLGTQQQPPFDMIVSNPPYVSHEELIEIPEEVSFEPRIALDGGKEGLDVILRLIDSLSHLLVKNGLFLCEIGASQENLLIPILKERGFSRFEILRDLAGLPRLLKLFNS